MMKQLLHSFLLAVVVFAPNLAVNAAGSATMSLDASVYEVTRGESFDVTVSVDPRGESLDTARATVTFDPSVLHTTNVRLAGSFDRVAPGNYFDSETGKVSWGAFTLEDPVTAFTPFITITFLAVATGEGNISISPDSRAISNGEERINTAELGEATVKVGEAPGAQPGVAVLALDSGSHPNQEAWYPNRSVELSWTQLEGDSPIEAYYYSFGLESDAQPNIYLDGETASLSLEASSDGIHYLRLKGVHQDGRETPVAQRVLRVDTTQPNPIDLSVQDDKILEGESAWFLFATTDEASGVVEYQVSINSSEFLVQTSPLEMEDLPVGTYFFRVAAFDRAGNVTYGGVSVRVYPEGTDLERAQGYESTGEVQAITASLQQAVTEISNNKMLLITVVLGVVALVGIIYLSRKRKS